MMMSRLDGFRSLFLPAIICCVCVTPSTAQEARIAREGLTGEALFQRKWEWKEPTDDSPPLKADQRPHSRTRAERRSDALESRLLSQGDGLGPLHNAKSCAECHAGGGASGVTGNVTLLTIDPRSEVINEIETGAESLRELFPALVASDGTLQFSVVVHNESTRAGYKTLRSGLSDRVPGGIDEAWFTPSKRTVDALSQKPVVAGRYKTIDFYLSQRNSPPLYGIGLIAQISPARIQQIADRQVKRSDGVISGRMAGKFGWRGQGVLLTSFIADACSVELGLTHDSTQFRPPSLPGLELRNIVPGDRLPVASPQSEDPADPEYFNRGLDLTQREVDRLAWYVSSLAAPMERAQTGHTINQLLAGEKHFFAVGCENCHVADIFPVRGLFSDLLLHHMGPGLADPSPAPLDGQIMTRPPVRFTIENPRPVNPVGLSYVSPATKKIPIALNIPRPAEPTFPRGKLDYLRPSWDTLQREWRTPPLWAAADTAPYLHDGRAATLEEAILWHGGEAATSRERYEALSDEEKQDVLAFLLSLRAPDSTEAENAD